MRPTHEENTGAQEERKAIRHKIRDMLRENDPPFDATAALTSLLEWISGRAKCTGKRAGGVGRK